MQEKIRTIAWCLLVLIDAYMLFLAFTTQSLMATALAAVMAYVVVKSSEAVPIPEIYRSKGITEEMFSGKARKKPGRPEGETSRD